MPSILVSGVEGILRRKLSPRLAALELLRRGRSRSLLRRERASLKHLQQTPARLTSQFQALNSAQLLKHFRERIQPVLLAGLGDLNATVALQHKLFPTETTQLISRAERMVKEHQWSLLGYGELSFGDPVNWLKDPLSTNVWPLAYHADIPLLNNDGADVRVLWELNRLGHLLALGRVYVITGEERFAEEIFKQIASWRDQNPVGLGPNWSCAMEVSLRAMNLLACLSLCQNSTNLTEERLLSLLTLLDQHGAHVKRNLEFSYLGNSNHYLSDIAGLLWIGTALPELSAAEGWRQWALRELLREMDQQILPDGSDYEGSTGYHRFVLELFLYSFILCEQNGIELEQRYWDKLRAMLTFVQGYLRPDGQAPLLGDTDGGRVLPFVEYAADEHAFLLPLGAVVTRDPSLKSPGQRVTEEMIWLLGVQGVEDFEKLPAGDDRLQSKAFPEAGVYVLRQDDNYLLFNASVSQRLGRASHRHNDALSLEIAACGRAFVVDPGSYVYSGDLVARHQFRSTAYHSTIEVDDTEQNTTDKSQPFILGNEAAPVVLEWKPGDERDVVVGEHGGYLRLRQPVKHRRSVTFNKRERWWMVEDELSGKGEHKVAALFHFDAGLEITVARNRVVASDSNSGASLHLWPLNSNDVPELEHQFTSNHYGARASSTAAKWTMMVKLPWRMRWVIVPSCSGENAEERLARLQFA